MSQTSCVLAKAAGLSPLVAWDSRQGGLLPLLLPALLMGLGEDWAWAPRVGNRQGGTCLVPGHSRTPPQVVAIGSESVVEGLRIQTRAAVSNHSSFKRSQAPLPAARGGFGSSRRPGVLCHLPLVLSTASDKGLVPGGSGSTSPARSAQPPTLSPQDFAQDTPLSLLT